MTLFTPFWLPDPSNYSADADRHLLAALWPAPAVTGCGVSGQPGTMIANIAPGAVAVPTVDGTGTLLCVSDDVEQIELNPGPGVGESRWDLIICQPRASDFVFEKVTGSSAGTPVVPATPPGTVALAQILIPAQAVDITPANVHDVRPARGLATTGAPGREPLPPGAPLTIITGPDGSAWVARGGVAGGAWRRAGEVLSAAYHRSAGFTVVTDPAVIPMNALEHDAYGLYNPVSGVFTCPLAGKWLFAAAVAATPGAGAAWVGCQIDVNGAVVRNSIAHSSVNSVWTGPTASLLRLLALGETVTVTGNASALLGGQISGQTYLQMAYVGAG